MFSHFLRKLGSFGRSRAARPVRSAGRRWHLAPDAAAVLDSLDLERWIAEGLATVVKTGPHRTVYRVTLPGETVYVKHCRINGFRAWAREVLRPAKARLEFENALALHAHGIAAVVPLAWGCPDSPWPGESYLITRSRDEVLPFAEIAECAGPELRRQLAHGLGRLFATLHDAGVAHPDPHPGNLLIEREASGLPRFCLIDLHAIRFGRPLSWAESRANLILFNRWFQLRASRADRLRFWHAYRLARRTLPTITPERWAQEARELEAGTAASNLRFWAGRVNRCRGNNRYFRRVKAGMLRGHAVRDLHDAVLRVLLADPDSLFTRPDARILKDSRTSTVAALTFTTPDGPRELILKRVNVRKGTEPVKNRFRLSPVLRSWVNGHTLRDRHLPTPRPLAAFHRYRHGLPAEGYLLTEKVPEAVELPDVATGAEPLRETSDRLARTVRLMHDRAVSHRDLKAPNILLEDGSPVLIDLVGVRVGRAVPFRQRVKELARLNASFLNSPRVRFADRLRFLRVYLAAGANRDAGWKAWWRAIAGATAAKVAKNRRSGRPLG